MRDKRFIDLLGTHIASVAASPTVRSMGETASEEAIEDTLYLYFPKHGIELRFDGERLLRSVFFDYTAISTEWVTGISERATRNEMLQRFGGPSKSGAAKTLPILGLQGAWDRWDYADHSLHVQYAPSDGTVVRVTLMHPLAVPA